MWSASRHTQVYLEQKRLLLVSEMIIQTRTENQSKAVNNMKSQSQFNFFTNVMEPQPAFFYGMTMMGKWLLGKAKNCPQNVTNSTSMVPGWSGRMVLGGGRERPKDYKTAWWVLPKHVHIFNAIYLLKCIWNEIFGGFFIVSCEKAFKAKTNSIYRLSLSFLVPQIWRFKVVKQSRKENSRFSKNYDFTSMSTDWINI